MPGPRRPMKVNLENGSKHWTKAEIDERQASEAKVPRPASLTCPKWLCKEAAKLFRGYAKELLENLPVSKLDAGTLARLCDAEWSYSEASKHKTEWLRISDNLLRQAAAAAECVDIDTGQSCTDPAELYARYGESLAQVTRWSKAMALYEKIARGAANDLGCTITSRCRLVVAPTTQDEADPLEQLQQGLRVLNA